MATIDIARAPERYHPSLSFADREGNASGSIDTLEEAKVAAVEYCAENTSACGAMLHYLSGYGYSFTLNEIQLAIKNRPASSSIIDEEESEEREGAPPLVIETASPPSVPQIVTPTLQPKQESEPREGETHQPSDRARERKEKAAARRTRVKEFLSNWFEKMVFEAPPDEIRSMISDGDRHEITGLPWDIHSNRYQNEEYWRIRVGAQYKFVNFDLPKGIRIEMEYEEKPVLKRRRIYSEALQKALPSFAFGRFYVAPLLEVERNMLDMSHPEGWARGFKFAPYYAHLTVPAGTEYYAYNYAGRIRIEQLDARVYGLGGIYAKIFSVSPWGLDIAGVRGEIDFTYSRKTWQVSYLGANYPPCQQYTGALHEASGLAIEPYVMGFFTFGRASTFVGIGTQLPHDKYNWPDNGNSWWEEDKEHESGLPFRFVLGTTISVTSFPND